MYNANSKAVPFLLEKLTGSLPSWSSVYHAIDVIANWTTPLHYNTGGAVAFYNHLVSLDQDHDAHWRWRHSGSSGGGDEKQKGLVHLSPWIVLIWCLLHTFDGLVHCWIETALEPIPLWGLQKCRWPYQLVGEGYRHQRIHCNSCLIYYKDDPGFPDGCEMDEKNKREDG